MSIREVTDQRAVPLILYTSKFEWKAKEIAIESGVDEYHIGFLDQSFIKRVKLIERVKTFKSVNGIKVQLKPQADERTSGRFWFLKRILDIAISLLIIFLLFPTLLIILPLLIFETKGSVICTSKRVGKNYKIFDLYKFTCLSSGFGQFLREAHLDGLPQLLNVLAGDMSLVGNCPIHSQDAEQLTADGIAWRFLAPAGMVGLWQFNGEGESKMSNWDCTKLDIEYAMTSTMWLDVRILFGYFLNLVAARRNKRAVGWCFGIRRAALINLQHDVGIMNNVTNSMT
jgi:lipopolysaccharide/colanic/teichoic acid biosynthesis glycosyltransferase